LPNRLTRRSNTCRVSQPGASATYTYDPNGNLTSKTEGTDSWTYTWNAENQLAKVEKNGSEVARFAYDPLGARVEKMAVSPCTSTSATRGANIESGAGEPGPAFSGREWDPEIGLYYYRARHYDPKIGRFVSEDTIALDGGDPNYYTCVGDEPVNWIDPTGKTAAAAAPALCAAGPPG
jgi:RHS repeat-associated protein